MEKLEIQRAALAIAKMRTPKSVKRLREWQARRDVDRLQDWRRFTSQIDDQTAKPQHFLASPKNRLSQCHLTGANQTRLTQSFRAWLKSPESALRAF